MAPIQRISPEGLISSPAFSHVAVVPPGATTIYVGGQNAVDAAGRLIGEGDAAVGGARPPATAETPQQPPRPTGRGEPSPGLRPKADAVGQQAPHSCGLKGRESLQSHT